jgi:hypothetical protein
MLCSVCSRIQLFIVLMIGGLTIALGETSRPPNALVYIVSPKDGDTVTSPFRVQFGLSGMGVAPAGVETPNTGHHHLLIDANESLDPNEPIHKTRNIFISAPDKPRRLLNCLWENTRSSWCWATGRIICSILPSCQMSLP